MGLIKGIGYSVNGRHFKGMAFMALETGYENWEKIHTHKLALIPCGSKAGISASEIG